MANLIETTTTSLIKPLEGARTRRFTASATIAPGYPVYVYSDGTIRTASATAAATNRVIGVCVQSLVSGDRGDVVTKGPILCLSGATPGAVVFVMNSAGGMDTTGGTAKTVVGVAESATVLLVMPHQITMS
jgi:hypothetical protein